MAPVIFEGFCLKDPGKFYMLRKAPRYTYLFTESFKMCMSFNCRRHMAYTSQD